MLTDPLPKSTVPLEIDISIELLSKLREKAKQEGKQVCDVASELFAKVLRSDPGDKFFAIDAVSLEELKKRAVFTGTNAADLVRRAIKEFLGKPTGKS